MSCIFYQTPFEPYQLWLMSSANYDSHVVKIQFVLSSAFPSVKLLGLGVDLGHLSWFLFLSFPLFRSPFGHPVWCKAPFTRPVRRFAGFSAPPSVVRGRPRRRWDVRSGARRPRPRDVRRVVVDRTVWHGQNTPTGGWIRSEGPL